jgi:hypothetical protein
MGLHRGERRYLLSAKPDSARVHPDEGRIGRAIDQLPEGVSLDWSMGLAIRSSGILIGT